MNIPVTPIPVYAYVLAACLLLTQGIYLFRDAQKHGHNAWFWGIWGLISCPMPLILYLLLARKIFKKNKS